MMTDLERAWNRLSEKTELTCVLAQDNVIYQSERKGIAPMMDLLDAETDLRGFSVADRIVGRAAAMLFVLAGVAAVHAQVMSRGALAVLEANGICAEYETLTEYIVNRQGDGMCPMEHAVQGIENPKEAREAIRRTQIALAKSKRNK